MTPDLSFESTQHYTTSQNFLEYSEKELISEKVLLQ